MFSYSCNGNEGCVWEDTTYVGSKGTNLDETSNSPVCTPLVLNEEEFLTCGICTPSNSEDTVIECGSATSSNNTSGILLESCLVGFDCNRDWSLLKSILKSTDTIRWNVLISRDRSSSLGFRVGAASYFTNVWVVSRSLKRSGLNIFESSIHDTTIASIILCGAINELLLGVVNKWVACNGSSRWDTSRSGERPAGTALFLVLDCCNFSLCNPINSIGWWCAIKIGSGGSGASCL